MSFATRCTACGTIFRVVQDQLRVSDGWVRCGRCSEVFNASEQLFDLEREAPPPWPPVATQAPSHGPRTDLGEPERKTSPHTRFDETEHQGWSDPERRHAAPPEAHASAPEPAPTRLAAAPAYPEPKRSEPEAPISEFESEHRRDPVWSPPPLPEDPRSHLPEPRGLKAEPDPAPLPDILTLDGINRPDVVLSPSLSRSAAELGKAPAPSAPGRLRASLEQGAQGLMQRMRQRAKPRTTSTAAPAQASATPSFVKRADSKARWQQPKVKLGLSVASVLLTACAAAQLTWHFKDALAAQSPQAQAFLSGLCTQLGCELEPWKRFDGLSVESSTLTQAGLGNSYKLSLNLHNKSDWPLAVPWIDLSLTDLSGNQVARRDLTPADFELKSKVLPARSEQTLQVVFSTGTAKVSGYTVELFHP